jgi:hypothetical protein
MSIISVEWFQTSAWADASLLLWNGGNTTSNNLRSKLELLGIVDTSGNRKTLFDRLRSWLIEHRPAVAANGEESSSNIDNHADEFNIEAVIQRRAANAVIQSMLVNTSNQYDSQSVCLTVSGSYLVAGLKVADRSDWKAGDFVLASKLNPTSPFTADQFAATAYVIYRITYVGSITIALAYVGFSKKREREWEGEQEFTIPSPMRLLLATAQFDIDLTAKYGALQLAKTDAVLLDANAGLKSSVDAFNGKIEYYSNKNDVEGRMENTRLIRRLCEEQLLAEINGSRKPIDFKPELGWKELTTKGTAWMIKNTRNTQNATANTQNTKAYALIKQLPAAADATTYTALLEHGWARSAITGEFSYADTVTLQSFVSAPFDGAADHAHTKVMLAEALRNVQNYLVFCFGSTYEGVFADVHHMLVTGAFGSEVWSGAYTRYEVESALYQVLSVDARTVSKDAYLVTNPGTDISTAAGICAALRLQFRLLAPSADSKLHFTDVASGRLFVAAASKRKVTVGGGNAGAAVNAVCCKYDLCRQLRVKNRLEKIVQCNRVECKLPHIDVSAWTQNRLTDLVSKLSPNLAPSLERQMLATIKTRK